MATTKKIFVGSISHTVDEDTLRAKLKEHGNLIALFYMMDLTQSHRGWAFATFETADEAKTAIEALNGKNIFPDSKIPLEARFANQKPSASSTSFQLPGGMARKIWQEYYTDDGIPYYYNSITGFTQWEKPAELEDATRVVPSQQRSSIGMLGNAATRFGPPGSNIFVFHVPFDWNDIDLVQHFQHFGNILSSRIQRDAQGKSRGFGFVSFDNPQAAVNAIRGMHGFCVAGRFLRVQLKKGEECFLTTAMQMQIADIVNSDQQRGRSYRSPY